MSMINDHNYKFFLPQVAEVRVASSPAVQEPKRRGSKYEPGEVSIEAVNENWYIAYRRVNGARKTFYVPTPWGNVYKWASELDDSQLEAAIQMFYDKWNFKADSSPSDRKCLDVALSERSHRQSPRSAFSPVIFAHEMGTEEDVFMMGNFISVVEEED